MSRQPPSTSSPAPAPPPIPPSSVDIRSSITTVVNDSIVRMKTVGKLRVLKRDRAMERPPMGSEGPAETAAWLTQLAKQWSEGTLASTSSASTSSPSAVPPPQQQLSLPPSLIELYASMASNGISFIGRFEAPSTAAIDKLFPSVRLTSCGPQPYDPFTIPNPAVAAAALLAQQQKSGGAAGDGAAANTSTSSSGVASPTNTTGSSATASSSSSSFAPVCMCHFNAIQRIVPIGLRVTGPTQQQASPISSPTKAASSAADGSSSSPTSPTAARSTSSPLLSPSTALYGGVPLTIPPRGTVAYSRDAVPIDGKGGDRYFVLWSGAEGAAKAHANCTAGDGTGVDVLLRYARHGPTSEPEVWGLVKKTPAMAAAAAAAGGEADDSAAEDGSDDSYVLFFISKTFFDFVRIGCLRYCWARLWPILLAPRAVREAYGLLEGGLSTGAGGLASTTSSSSHACPLSTMRPWLAVFATNTVQVASEGIVPCAVRAVKVA